MRPLMLLSLIAACGEPESPPSPDTPPPPPSCRAFGPLASSGAIAKVSTTGIESDPSVLREGGTYKMWFTTANPTAPANLRTAYAESADGTSWHEVADAAIVPGTGFDGNGVETVAVVHAGAQYVAYYTGDTPPEGSIRFAIGRATSPDGVVWTRDAEPVLAPQLPWELPFCADDACSMMIGGTLEPTLLYDGTTYRMWYAALGALDAIPSFRLGYATSTDGIAWTREPDPVFVAGPAGSWDEALVSHANVIAEPSGGFHLFYFGSSLADSARCDAAGGCLLTPGSIGHAFSSDGIHWTRDADPVLSPGGFAAWSIGGPSALIEDGVLKLWYFGTPEAQTIDIRLGFASAPCR